MGSRALQATRLHRAIFGQIRCENRTAPVRAAAACGSLSPVYHRRLACVLLLYPLNFVPFRPDPNGFWVIRKHRAGHSAIVPYKIWIDSQLSQEQDRATSVSVCVLVVGILMSAGGMSHGAGADVQELRRQLAAAQDATDKPAIIELSSRIVEADSQDSKAWETLARTTLDAAEYDRCAATLDAWEKTGQVNPPVIDDVRGDLAAARKDYGAAERYWRRCITTRPNAADTLEKLADLCADQERWSDALQFRTRALALNETAAGRIRRANLYLQLHEWDKAVADADRANALDPSDATVKEWLPRFELLRKFLPRIKALDAQIGSAQSAAALWLDRARLFTLSNEPDLALRDCRRAMKLGPGMMRARVQTGEALLDLGRGDEEAKLNVS